MSKTGAPDTGDRSAASTQLFETVLEGMSHGILVADIETKRFPAANSAFYGMLGGMLGCTLRQALQLTVEDMHPRET